MPALAVEKWHQRVRGPALDGGLAFVVRLRFLDQHHRDPVDDRVDHFAVGAAQLVGLSVLDLGMALGTGQDLEQLFRYHAGILSAN